MRRLLVAAALVLALPTLGAAAPVCVSGTLGDYIALGAEGCTIGGATVAGFSSAASPAGGVEVLAADIVVVPVALASGLRLEFGIDASAAAGELVGALVGYSVTGPAFTGALLSMSGSTAGSASDPFDTGGVVTVVEDLCLGETFLPFFSCFGTPETLIAVHDQFGAFPSDARTFGPTSFFDVFVDIAVDGGTGGSASLRGIVANQYSTVAAVPEPATVLLVGSGVLALLAGHRRRR